MLPVFIIYSVAFSVCYICVCCVYICICECICSCMLCMHVCVCDKFSIHRIEYSIDISIESYSNSIGRTGLLTEGLLYWPGLTIQ